MKQISIWGIMTPAHTRTISADHRSDSLYKEAQRLYQDGFAVISIDATNVPEELIGEVVELIDFCYPRNSDEPMFDVAGINEPVPMSALTSVN